MKIHLARFVCLDIPSNLHRMKAEAELAANNHADLCVFPESFLHGYTRHIEPQEVRSHFAATSAEHPRTTFVFGSFTEERRNRMTVWQAGRELAAYDKVHLFTPNLEDEIWDPGDRYTALHLGDWTLGLLNCNDLRFPEQARALRLKAGCDLLLAIGWWPWRRDHVWRTLLQARAIENGIFSIGCCIASSQHPDENFAGAGNYVFDPLGEAIPTNDDHTYILDRHRLDAVLVDPRKAAIEINNVEIFEERVQAMGGAALGAPVEGGKESDESLGGPKDEELDVASRRLPPQPFG
jgi:omega-amidase